MAVTAQTPIKAYTASGASGVFAYPFQVLAAADLVVLVDGAVASFVATGIGDASGGTVTVSPTPSAGQRVVLYRDSALTRDTDYQDSGDLLAAVLNRDIDRVWLALQEVLQGAKASPATVRAPAGETLPELPDASARAGTALLFDDAGAPYCAAPASGSASDLALSLASSDPEKGDALLAVKAALTGAVARTQHEKNGDWVSIADFGARLDGVTDDTEAWQAAAAVGGLIVVPGGKTTLITDTITFAVDRTVVLGAGPYVCVVKFNPAAAKPCFYFNRGASSVAQSGVVGIGFTSDNSVDKTAIKIRDGRHCVVADIGISQGAWQGSGSIGLHTLGRDTLVAGRFAVSCARPILIDKNPNYATLHCDHFHFHDMELATTETAGKCVEIVDGVNISNLSFTGFHAWALGKYGLYWNDTTSTINSAVLNIYGVRTEQATDSSGYSIYLASTVQPLKSLSIASSYFDSARNGIYLRNVHTVSLEDSFLSGAAGRTNLDVTFEASTEFSLRNTFVNAGSTVTLTSAVALHEAPWSATNRACTATGLWRYDEGALVSRKAQRVDGVLGFRWKGSMTDVSQINLPVLTAGGALVATWRISAAGSTKHEAAFGSWKPGASMLVANSGNVVTTSTAGKLAVIDTGTGLGIVNRLGESVNVVVDVTWAD